MTLSNGVSAMTEPHQNCGNDYNCYYENKAKQEKMEKDMERQEQQDYRNQQLEMQEQEIRETQENRIFMEQQMQTNDSEKYEKLPQD
jgi:hypothetical protein